MTQRTIQGAWVVHVGDFPLDGDLFPVNVPSPSPIPVEGEESSSGGARTPVPPTAIKTPEIVTLAVTPQDAVAMVWFVEAQLPITFALRSTHGVSASQTRPVTLDYIMSEYNINEPPPTLDYSIQPAIRSIRQLVAGQQISLSGN
jgi:hypothetical protein